MPRSIQERCEWIMDQVFTSLVEKIGGGSVRLDNEASLQLHFASIVKSLGELAISSREDWFSIELEKVVHNPEQPFKKSGSNRAKIDIWFCLEDLKANTRHRVAVELKYFKRANQREPNNRADVFKDILNLECYGDHADMGYMIVLTDHPHYYEWREYSEATADFDFRDGKAYEGGTMLTYDTVTPYVEPFALNGNYDFNWVTIKLAERALLLPVKPITEAQD